MRERKFSRCCPISACDAFGVSLAALVARESNHSRDILTDREACLLWQTMGRSTWRTSAAESSTALASARAAAPTGWPRAEEETVLCIS